MIVCGYYSHYKGFAVRARGTGIVQETPEKGVWRPRSGTGTHMNHTLGRPARDRSQQRFKVVNGLCYIQG